MSVGVVRWQMLPAMLLSQTLVVAHVLHGCESQLGREQILVGCAHFIECERTACVEWDRQIVAISMVTSKMRMAMGSGGVGDQGDRVSSAQWW